MSESDSDARIQARPDSGRRRAQRDNRKLVYLVSYPRSGNTLVREYFSPLQGRAQQSIYPGDVVDPTDAALTHALDHIEIIKSHRIPADGSPMIYLVRDGRNATLSFLYMTFLFGGHQYSELSEAYEGIWRLDATEGCWADHVAEAVRQSEARQVLFVRYEDVVLSPETALRGMIRFMNADVPAAVLRECVRRHRGSDKYAQNPYNGFLYEPAKGSIYDILKRRRGGDYWRHILDGRSRRYFHDRGATPLLLHFGYERSADWWEE
jgi:Sulfotransferase domain